MSYRITARDSQMVEFGPIDYALFDADLRLMGAGGTDGLITAQVPNSDQTALELLNVVGGGIVVRDESTQAVVASGDLVEYEVADEPGGLIRLAVEPDDSIARDEVAFPEPGTDVPTSSTSTSPNTHDVRTGAAETVALAYLAANIGPAASITRRRYPWLVIPSSAGRGGSGTWRARDTVLLDLLRRILIPAGLAFRFAQHPAGNAVLVEVWQPAVVPVPFSVAAGTARGVRILGTAPSADEVIVAGGGSGTARVRTRRTSGTATGRRRHTRWIDQRQTSDLTELRQAADEALADGAVTRAARFELVEDPVNGPRFGRDYGLGSLASVADRRGQVATGRIQSVQITHDPRVGEPLIHPAVGTPDTTGSQLSAAATRALLDSLLRS